jgi:hypothetical protein
VLLARRHVPMARRHVPMPLPCRWCGLCGLHGRVEQCISALQMAVSRARHAYPARAAEYDRLQHEARAVAANVAANASFRERLRERRSGR